MLMLASSLSVIQRRRPHFVPGLFPVSSPKFSPPSAAFQQFCTTPDSKMTSITFIAQPPNLFRTTGGRSICQRNNVSKCRRHRLTTVVSMGAQNGSNERNLSVDKSVVDNSQDQPAPEFIDIVDADIEAEDIDVIEALGSEFEVHKEKRKKVRQRTRSFMDEIMEGPDSLLTDDAARQPPIEEDETTAYVRSAARAADLRKAEDIVALRISKLTYITSFILIATANNAPQIRAIGNLVEEELAKEHDLHTRRKDGTAGSGWLLLDCMYCAIISTPYLLSPPLPILTLSFLLLFPLAFVATSHNRYMNNRWRYPC